MFITVRLLRLSILWLAVSAVSSALAFAEPSAIWRRAANNIQLQRELRPGVEQMLRTSPTFRVQYQRVSEARALQVGVRIDPTLALRTNRAESTIRRYNSGLMIAEVAIGPSGDRAQWIAHEFEHIIEQLDGWHLPSMIGGGSRELWYGSGGMIETRRAIRVGRVVMEEMRLRRLRPDKLVEVKISK